MKNVKDIHIGDLLYKKVKEEEIEINRICKFLQKTENEIVEMYSRKSVDSEMLFKMVKAAGI